METDYVDLYYREFVSAASLIDDPPNETDKEITRGTIQHLIDNHIPDGDILKALVDYNGDEKYVSPKFLPEWLWSDSLITKGHFYFHHVLQLVSPPTIFNPITKKKIVSPFYLEMRIRFTINDLIVYFQRQSGIKRELIDVPKFTGQLISLLKQYKRFEGVEPLDMVMCLIDYAKKKHRPIYQPFDIDDSDSKSIVYEHLISNKAQAKLEKRDRIIWRFERCLKP